jgi:hypothetical protein
MDAKAKTEQEIFEKAKIFAEPSGLTAKAGRREEEQNGLLRTYPGSNSLHHRQLAGQS